MWRRYRADDVDTHAAALAYQLFLSTLALSIVALAILGLVAERIDLEVPERAEAQIRHLRDGGLLLGAVALAGLLWTASAFGIRASRALGVVFRTSVERRQLGRGRGVVVALGMAVVVGAFPVLTGILATLELGGGLEVPARAIALAVVVALELGLFLLSYVALTPGNAGWRRHLPGAIVMTVGWELFKLLGALVLALLVRRATLTYGTIGAVVGLLVFLRLVTLLYLVGAELSAASPTRNGVRPRARSPPRCAGAPRSRRRGTRRAAGRCPPRPR